MKTCPSCGTANEEARTLCEKCGRALDIVLLLDRNVDRGLPTTHWSGPAGTALAIPRVVPLEKLFDAGSRVVIGRAPDCDVCLQHPSVSRYHALLERLPEGLRLSDLRSVNGVFVDGRRLTSPLLVREHQRIGI